MQNISKFVVLSGIVLALVVFTGAGCETLNKAYQQANNVAIDASSIKMPETEYYNKVIQNMNEMSDYTGIVSDAYDRFVEYKDVEMRSNFIAQPTYSWYDNTKRDLVDNKPTMDNAEAQAKIEEKLISYLTEYKIMLDAYGALGEYYERGRYKDDHEAQTDTLAKALATAIDKVYDMQQEIFDLVDSYQNQINLGIDENTQDPLEVAILGQDKITNAAEQLYQDYSTWIEVYDADGQADIAAMQASYDKFTAAADTYSAKAEAVHVKDSSFAGSSWTSYIDAVNAYEMKFKNLLRNAKANEVGDLTTLDKEVSGEYNDLIDAHNNLVSSLNTTSSMSQ